MASKSRFLDNPGVGAFGSSNNSLTSTSASYAASATSASYAVTASYALFAVSASHEIVKEVSSSHANTADVAGGLQGQPSISVTNVTASGNVSGSATSTASFGTYLGDGSQLSNISTTPFPFSGSAVITGSLIISGSEFDGLTTPAVDKLQLQRYTFQTQKSYTGGPGSLPYNGQLIISGSDFDVLNPMLVLYRNSNPFSANVDEGMDLWAKGNMFVGGPSFFNGKISTIFSVTGSSVSGGGGEINLGNPNISLSANSSIGLFGHLTASAGVNISASATSTITSGFVTSLTSSHDYIQAIEGGNNIKIDGKDGGVSLHYTEDPDFSSIEIADNIKLNVSSDSASIDLSQTGIEFRGPIKTYAITASVNVSSSATSTASFGTYLGDGSQLSGISSTPFPFTGDAQITGSLTVSGSFLPHGKGPTSNVIIGNLAGDSITSGGVNNVYIGQEAGEAAGSGDANVVIGWKAGEASTNDSNCILIGFKAGGASSLGNSNIYIGYEAGRDATSTHGNIGIGPYALHESDNGGGSGYNAAFGYSAGYSITSGDYNLFLGYKAGHDITTGANNIIIGSGSKGEAGISNQLRIGHSDLITISASLATGDIIFRSTASAAYFSGDGSQLTNLPASSTFPFTGTAGITGSISITGSAQEIVFAGGTSTNYPKIDFPDSINIGNDTTMYTGSLGDVVIGQNADTNYAGTYFSTKRRIAIGLNADVSGGGSIAIGHGASAASTDGVAIGYNAASGGLNSVAIGSAASGASNGVVIGANSSVAGQHSIAIKGTQTSGTGYGVTIGGTVGATGVAVGYGSSAGSNSTGIGYNADATGTGAVAIGPSIKSSGLYAISIGTRQYGGSQFENPSGSSFAIYHNNSTPTFFLHKDDISYYNSSGKFGFNTLTPTATLTVSGSFTTTGSAIMSSSNSDIALSVQGSGSTVFEVLGSAGTLFSVDDSLTGTLFSANDISGLPVLQADATGEVYLGKSPQSLYTTAVISATSASATASVSALSTSSYDGAFFDYTITSASNARAGSIMSVWSGDNISFTETTTTDIGSTSGINFQVIISASQAQLVSITDSTAPNTWKVKTIIKAI